MAAARPNPFQGLSDPNADLVAVAQDLVERAIDATAEDGDWHRRFMHARRWRNRLQAEAQKSGAGDGPAPEDETLLGDE